MKYFWLVFLWILEITISLISIKKSLCQCHPLYTRWVSWHRVLYLKFLSTCNMCIIYLLVIDAYLKVTITMFYFCHSKNPSDVIKNIFNSISINLWKKISLLTNIRNKRVIRKINLYFLASWKIATFSLQKFVIYNLITDSFLIEKCGKNIREYNEVRLKMKNRLGRVFPSHFLQNIFIETSNVSYLVLFHFLMPRSLKIQERNHQLTWPLMILFQGITRLKAIWMLKVSTYFFPP